MSHKNVLGDGLPVSFPQCCCLCMLLSIDIMCDFPVVVYDKHYAIAKDLYYKVSSNSIVNKAINALSPHIVYHGKANIALCTLFTTTMYYKCIRVRILLFSPFYLFLYNICHYLSMQWCQGHKNNVYSE